jgi:hypothetical protein
MVATKLKVAAAFLAVCLVGVGAGGLAYHGQAAEGPTPAPAGGKDLPPPPDDRQKLVCKDYPVADLVRPDNNKQLELLIQTIRNVVDPDSWAEAGGRGTIEYYPLGMSLVIQQSAGRHERVKALLEALRKAKTEQPPAPRASNLRIEATPQGTKVEAQNLRGTAQRISYDEANGVLVLEGSADSPARLILSLPGQSPEFRAVKIICSWGGGNLVVESLPGPK